MLARLVAIFIILVGVLLIVTGVAKLMSSFGTARLLEYPDPVFLVSYRNMFRVFGVTEMIVAAFCFTSNNQKLQAGVIAFIASNFLLYRIGIYWLGYRSICPCLGSMSAMLHIPSEVADTILKVIMAFMLVGGYGSLLYLWLAGKGKQAWCSEAI